MPSEPSPSQSISISGRTVNSPIAQAQGNINQSQQIGSDNSAEQLQSSDVLALLDQLKALVDSSSLPANEKKKVLRDVETAKDGVDADQADKEYGGNALSHAIKVLKSANEALGEGASLWEKSAPILQKVLPYFGLALTILV
jgi:hypothetical protein